MLSGAATGRERTNGTAPPAAAPPSRGSSSARTARLTQDEREAAEASGLSEEEYANNKLALKTAGRLN